MSKKVIILTWPSYRTLLALLIRICIYMKLYYLLTKWKIHISTKSSIFEQLWLMPCQKLNYEISTKDLIVIHIITPTEFDINKHTWKCWLNTMNDLNVLCMNIVPIISIFQNDSFESQWPIVLAQIRLAHISDVSVINI